MSALKRLVCRIFGHAWSAWPQLRGPCAYCGKKPYPTRPATFIENAIEGK